MKPAAPSKSWESPFAARREWHIGHGHDGDAAAAALIRGEAQRPILLDRRRTRPSEIMTRRKVWDLDGSLHCSVIGTCLTGGELRMLVGKFHPPLAEKPTDHTLHTVAVASVSKRGLLAKQIQKALDRRHAAAIRRFNEAKNVEDLRRCWSEARQAGEIPGAYWAVLTHPRADDDLICDVFGDVHMLSHLVGAANRADIRRLHQLEEEKAALEEKLARQQAQLRDGIVSRDTKILELNKALSALIERQSQAQPSKNADSASEVATLHDLVGDLRKLLDRETLRREKAEKRVDELTAAQAKSEQARREAAEEIAALKSELDTVETRLAVSRGAELMDDNLDLRGMTILYVGGRPQQVARLRALIEQASGQLISHDGGIEERPDLLPGLVSRADAAFFPVDCISHRAALSLKRLCQQAGKPYVPLRSASLASMLRALRELPIGAAPRSAAE